MCTTMHSVFNDRHFLFHQATDLAQCSGSAIICLHSMHTAAFHRSASVLGHRQSQTCRKTIYHRQTKHSQFECCFKRTDSRLTMWISALASIPFRERFGQNLAQDWKGNDVRGPLMPPKRKPNQNTETVCSFAISEKLLLPCSHLSQHSKTDVNFQSVADTYEFCHDRKENRKESQGEQLS